MDPGLLGPMCPDEGAGDARGPGAWSWVGPGQRLWVSVPSGRVSGWMWRLWVAPTRKPSALLDSWVDLT